MPTYSKALQEHLANYKRSRLGVAEPGTFKYRGQDLPYEHILPKDLRWLNILESIRTDVCTYLDQNPSIKLHKFFHHLNSSQAFAFNLFFPYFEHKAPTELLNAMGLPNDFSDWTPEYVADTTEGTNVDVAWRSNDGRWTYCEVKLSEQEFGTAEADERHHEKLEKIYRPVLSGQCAAELLEPHTFFSHYQLLRNVWLAARDSTSTVVFLVPRANLALWPQLEPLLERLSPELRSRVKAVAIEDVLSSLADSVDSSPILKSHALHLREKYVISGAAA